MLIFERRTHNRSVNRTELYFLQQTRPEVFSRGKKRHGGSLIWQAEIAHFSPVNLKDVNDYAVAETGSLCKRKPKMIPKTPNTIAYEPMSHIRASAPGSGFHRSMIAVVDSSLAKGKPDFAKILLRGV